MAGIGVWGQQNMLNWCLRGATPTQPANVYVSLAMAAPGSVPASMSEVGAGSGYTRQSAGFAGALTPAGSGSISNNAAMTFGPFSSSQAIVGLCILDHSVSTTALMWFGNLTTARTPLTGDSLVIAVG